MRQSVYQRDAKFKAKGLAFVRDSHTSIVSIVSDSHLADVVVHSRIFEGELTVERTAGEALTRICWDL